MTLSLYIAALKFGMILLQELTHFPVIIATFIASLFEAHAILAVNAGSFSSQLSLWEMHFIMLIILTGSLISKMFFVYRGKVLSQKRKLFIPILTSFFFNTSLNLYVECLKKKIAFLELAIF